MGKRKPLDTVMLCFQIILPVLIVLPLAFFSYRLVEGRLEDLANLGDPGYHSGMGLYIFASHVVLLGANLVLAAVSGIWWLAARRYKSSPVQRKHVVAFRWLTLAPAASQILYVIVNVIAIHVI